MEEKEVLLAPARLCSVGVHGLEKKTIRETTVEERRREDGGVEREWRNDRRGGDGKRKRRGERGAGARRGGGGAESFLFSGKASQSVTAGVCLFKPSPLPNKAFTVSVLSSRNT